MKNRFTQLKWRVPAAAMVIGSALCLAAAQQAHAGDIPCRYEVAAIIPGPFCSGFGNDPMYPRGLSNHDQPWVAGFHSQCTIGFFKPFVWKGIQGTPVQSFAVPGQINYDTFAADVTDTGWVVGTFPSSPDPWRGFIFDTINNTWTFLVPAIPGGGVTVRAANNMGMVVGSRTISETAYNAFIYHNGKYTDLGVMNGPNSEAREISDDGIVVGWTGTTSSSTSTRAFIHQNGTTTIISPPAGVFSTSGKFVYQKVVVGLHCTVPNAQGLPVARGGLWQNGRISLLVPLTGYGTSFVAGAIATDAYAGTCGAPLAGGSGFVPCLWRQGVAVNLNSLISANAGVYLQGVIALNDNGAILCEGITPSGQVAVVLSPVFPQLGDVTLDCVVNVNDLLAVINSWGQTSGPADVNQDGIVNYQDLLLVLQNWST